LFYGGSIIGALGLNVKQGTSSKGIFLMETIFLSFCLEHGKIIEEILGKLKETNTQ
jgi:hypothetical protein